MESRGNIPRLARRCFAVGGWVQEAQGYEAAAASEPSMHAHCTSVTLRCSNPLPRYVGILRWISYTHNIHYFHILWQLKNCAELWWIVIIVIIVARSWPSMWRGSLTEVRRPGTDTCCLYNANSIQYAPGALTIRRRNDFSMIWFGNEKTGAWPNSTKGSFPSINNDKIQILSNAFTVKNSFWLLSWVLFNFCLISWIPMFLGFLRCETAWVGHQRALATNCIQT